MKKTLFAFLLVLLALVGLTNAFCPVCVVAVGVGVGLLRSYGVDDVITGLWLGGFIVSCIYWLIDWTSERNIRFFLRKKIIAIAMYALFLIPMFWMGLIGNPYNTIMGVDRLLAGIILGSVIFFLAVRSDADLRELNEGKAFFPFQKVIIPILYLVISSLIAYYFILPIM